jgi:putative sigma-54 modulation protein
MEKIIAGRHIELDDAVKSRILDEIAELEDIYPKLTSARVIVEEQRQTHRVEIVIHGKHLNIDAEGRDRNLMTAVNAAVAKAERQLRRFVDKAQEHHPHHSDAKG